MEGNDGVIKAIGSLEATVGILVDRIDDYGTDLKGINKTCQSFEEYKAARKDLPDRITTVEAITEDYKKYKIEQETHNQRTDVLWSQYRSALVAAAVINALALLLGFMFTRGWLVWAI